MHFNLPELIKSLGYFGVWGIIFAESGLLIGFFLPGDSLLFTAGFVASQNLLNIWVLIFGAFFCAVLGDNVGYFTGHKFGRKLFEKDDSWLFRKKHIVKTQDFYEKHGKKTIVLARSMHYRSFMSYNLIGGFVWTFGITLLGFFLGKTLPAEQLDKYLLPIIGLIVVVSLFPSVIHVIKENRANK